MIISRVDTLLSIARVLSIACCDDKVWVAMSSKRFLRHTSMTENSMIYKLSPLLELGSASLQGRDVYGTFRRLFKHLLETREVIVNGSLLPLCAHGL